MISAKVILGSTTEHGKPIWTIEAHYHRYIHGEIMTHGMFSRNTMSSRAVPVKKVIWQVLKPEQWHMPYSNFKSGYQESFARSAASCARVSYLTHDGKTTTLAADSALFNRLVGSSPRHSSPIEHQAMALPNAGTPLIISEAGSNIVKSLKECE